jgi:hypothetical protein
MSRQGVFAAAVAVVVAGSACGVGAEPDAQQAQEKTASSQQELRLNAFNLPTRQCRTLTVRPDASGTLASAPQVNMLEVAPVGSAVQSMYFNSPSTGAETRRGLVEIAVPALNGHITAASLVFTDQHGWAFQQVPADWHTLELLPGASTISTVDYASEGAPFATFSTDMNALQPQTHTFDVFGSVTGGQTTGFRFSLQKINTQLPSSGSAFTDFHLDITVCDEAALPHGTFGGTVGPAH